MTSTHNNYMLLDIPCFSYQVPFHPVVYFYIYIISQLIVTHDKCLTAHLQSMVLEWAPWSSPGLKTSAGTPVPLGNRFMVSEFALKATVASSWLSKPSAATYRGCHSLSSLTTWQQRLVSLSKCPCRTWVPIFSLVRTPVRPWAKFLPVAPWAPGSSWSRNPCTLSPPLSSIARSASGPLPTSKDVQILTNKEEPGRGKACSTQLQTKLWLSIF